MIDDDDTSIFLRVGGLQQGDHSDELHLPKTSSIILHILPILQPGDIHKLAGDVLLLVNRRCGLELRASVTTMIRREWGYYAINATTSTLPRHLPA